MHRSSEWNRMYKREGAKQKGRGQIIFERAILFLQSVFSEYYFAFLVVVNSRRVDAQYCSKREWFVDFVSIA